MTRLWKYRDEIYSLNLQNLLKAEITLSYTGDSFNWQQDDDYCVLNAHHDRLELKIFDKYNEFSIQTIPYAHTQLSDADQQAFGDGTPTITAILKAILEFERRSREFFIWKKE